MSALSRQPGSRGMKPLPNPRRERFAREYVRLGIARHAYVAAGYKAALPASPDESSAADAAASRLLKDVKVRQRIEGIKAMAAKRHDVTIDSLIEELEEARAKAAEASQPGAMVQATMGKARITGHIVDRKEVGKPGDFESMSLEELRAYVASLEGNGIAANAADSAADGQALPAPTHDGGTSRN
jgi:phage terminase small subunit